MPNAVFSRCKLCLAGLLFAFVATLNATSVRPPQFAELVERANWVVRAETIRVRSEPRQSASAKWIVTVVTMRVLRAVVGAAPETIELEFLGGTIGDESLRVSDQPQFQPGDRDILFVENNGRQICPLVAMMYGRYPLVQDPLDRSSDIVLRSNGEVLQSVTDVARTLHGTENAAHAMATPVTRMSATEFEARIRETAGTLGRKDVAP